MIKCDLIMGQIKDVTMQVEQNATPCASVLERGEQ